MSRAGDSQVDQIDFAPGRLWSLWDLMQRFNGGKLFIAITGLSNMGHSAPAQSAYAIPFKTFEQVKHNVEFICSELSNIGLPNSLVSAETLRSIFENEVEKRTDLNQSFSKEMACFSPLVFGRFRHYAIELVNRFKDELSAKIVFIIPQGKVSYYQTERPLFGEGVFNAFPSANDDIAESGTCLALERGTACVMHLMRACEVGLAALGKKLDVSKQNDWGSYLREIEKELVNRAKSAGARTPDEQFYAESATSFDHLRRAWRNPTMHVDRSYSPERAEEIFQAVKSFMRHLAIRLNERA